MLLDCACPKCAPCNSPTSRAPPTACASRCAKVRGARIATRCFRRDCSSRCAATGIPREGGIHTLRHAFATHLIEAGVDVHTLQRLLGHGHISTTLRYVHLARSHLTGTTSPLELLDPAPR